jgi:hypothetical protein
MLEEYRALVAKVEVFTDATSARRRADLACRAGCDACCQAWLTVSAVEAARLAQGIAQLSPEERAALAQRGARELAREQAGERGARCAMLRSDGSCAVYEARPLVCRTQGHALRYPAGFVPEGALVQRTEKGDVTHCPLNYTQAKPDPADVLDAERVDQILAVVNHRFTSQFCAHADPRASTQGMAADERVPLSELAARASVLERERFQLDE